MLKKITSLLLAFLLTALLVINVCAQGVQINGEKDLSAGQTAEYVISVDGCGEATSASVEVSCGDGISVISGGFIKEGSIKVFDLKTNKGAIGGLTSGDINGEFFKLSVKAKEGEGLSTDFAVTVTAKNGANEIFRQSASLSGNNPQSIVGSSKSALTVSGGTPQTQNGGNTVSTLQNNPASDPVNDTSPYLYIAFGVIALALAVLIIIVFKKKNKKD